jgi:DNA repair protein RadA/Sms
MSKAKNKSIFTCQNCGAQRSRWEGRCSDCNAWNTFVEEKWADPALQKNKGWALGKSSAQKTVSEARPMSGGASSQSNVLALDQKIEVARFERVTTGIGELDRVLGGGLARGGFVLLGGSPGIGKSTLLLQMAGGLAKHDSKVLYVSGEESVSQTAHRAHRLNVRSAKIEIAAESNLQTILDLAQNKRPDVLIVDSVQTVFHPDLEAAPGSVSQVRECAGHLMSLAKNEGIAVVLIGHVTKDGAIAGPKVLEHMVDCVLSFDGDMAHHFRLLRSLKNRFGPTHELGVFKMVAAGLEEVDNPSELFLEERGENLVGSVVFASMEGTRPLLCEIQALTLSSPMAMPRRTTLGIEANRLHMITAVLDRHLETQLSRDDIYVNVVGGLKLEEPSADLAVAAAILSTEGHFEIEAKSVYFGEVGLTGEIRAVSFPELRLKEALKLGFDHFIMPQSNQRHLDFTLPKGKRITFVKSVKELQKALGKNR